MSEVSPTTKTKDVLIEICPECSTLHIYRLTNGIIEKRGVEELICNTQIGTLEPTEEGKEASLILCTHKIKANENNTFTIKRWTFRERQEFYRMIGTFNQPIVPGTTQPLKVNINPKVMDYAINTCTITSPQPLKNSEDLDKTTIDGAILEALYGQILDWNSPPLAQFSISRQRYTQTT